MPGPRDPLTALRKAQGIDVPSSHPEMDWLGTAVQGLLGTVGLGDERSTANRGGQMLSAALPGVGGVKRVIGRGLTGPHPAIRALMDVLSGAPSGANADRLALSESLGSYVPHRSIIVAPEGFSLEGTSAFPGRAPELSEQYIKEQNRFRPADLDRITTSSSGKTGNFPLASSPYGTKLSRSLVPPSPRARWGPMPSEFESKFSAADALRSLKR